MEVGMQKGVVVVHITNFSIPHVKYHICSTEFPFDPPMQSITYLLFLTFTELQKNTSGEIGKSIYCLLIDIHHLYWLQLYV